jgi:hypothetical protein
MSRSRLPLATLLLLASATCAGAEHRWAEVRFHDITFTNLYHAVADMLDAEGYAVGVRNPGQGMIESEWQYGISLREIRGPARRKVFAHIEAGGAEQPGQWVVRVRVAEEVIVKGGMMATDVRHSDDWEEHGDNYDEAELLAAKIRALLADKAVRGAQVVVPVGDDGP